MSFYPSTYTASLLSLTLREGTPSSSLPAVEAAVDECRGVNSTLFWRSKSSYWRRRSRSCLSGNLGRRLRESGCTHCAPARTQLVQGNVRLHLTLRFLHRAQASTRPCFKESGSGDIALPCHTKQACFGNDGRTSGANGSGVEDASEKSSSAAR